MSAQRPVFYFDLYSPYAYLAAKRIDSMLPVQPLWRPIFFGALLAERGRVPWSMRADLLAPGQRQVERIAEERGLPEVHWPVGWPADSYALGPVRAVCWAICTEQETLAKALSMAFFEWVFVAGRALSGPEAIDSAADRSGLSAQELHASSESEAAKALLRRHTDEAVAVGVQGIPTVKVAEQLFWGDDQLEQSRAAVRAAQ